MTTEKLDQAANQTEPNTADAPPAESADAADPPAQDLKRSLRAVAQERNQARARVRELESQSQQLQARLAEVEQRLQQSPDPAKMQDELTRARADLGAAEKDLRRYRVEMPLLEAFARHQCAAPMDALRLVGEHVRLGDDGRLTFTDPDDPTRPLVHEDGVPFDAGDFARYVLERKPHLSLRPPAVGSAAPNGTPSADAPRAPDSRKDPDAYRRYYIRKYGKDPRSVISF